MLAIISLHRTLSLNDLPSLIIQGHYCEDQWGNFTPEAVQIFSTIYPWVNSIFEGLGLLLTDSV